MSEYIVTCDEETAAWIGNDVDSMRPIVRCHDCVNAIVSHPLNPITGTPAGIEYWRCDHFWNADELCEVEPDGFCAWGERKGDAE